MLVLWETAELGVDFDDDDDDDNDDDVVVVVVDDDDDVVDDDDDDGGGGGGGDADDDAVWLHVYVSVALCRSSARVSVNINTKSRRVTLSVLWH